MIEIKRTTMYLLGFIIVFLLTMTLLWRNEAIQLKEKNQLLRMAVDAKFQNLKGIEKSKLYKQKKNKEW